MIGCYSDWRPVASCVPLGPELAQLLFAKYINNLDDNFVNTVREFSDYTKIDVIVL